MTDREKAIKMLEEISDYFFGVYHRSICRGCPYKINDECEDGGCFYSKAIEDALALLKEQEAVEPVLDIDTLTCGNCNHPLEHDYLVAPNVLYHDRYNYCPYCGKKVKWND